MHGLAWYGPERKVVKSATSGGSDPKGTNAAQRAKVGYLGGANFDQFRADRTSYQREIYTCVCSFSI